MGFSQVFFLLQQECYLADSCLTIGLTALRNAHAGDKALALAAGSLAAGSGLAK